VFSLQAYPTRVLTLNSKKAATFCHQNKHRSDQLQCHKPIEITIYNLLLSGASWAGLRNNCILPSNFIDAEQETEKKKEHFQIYCIFKTVFALNR